MIAGLLWDAGKTEHVVGKIGAEINLVVVV